MGPHRNGRVTWLPDEFPSSPLVVWRLELSSQGLGGVVATSSHVITSDRDVTDRFDIFRCLDATSGKEMWQARYLAEGQLDYGNSPRATPLIHRGKVYTLSAFGHLHCYDLESGKIHWKKELAVEFGLEEEPTWGIAGSPIVVGDRLIVSPGGPHSSLVALNIGDGSVLWSSPGAPPAYASLVEAQFQGRHQVIGYDRDSMGGWDVATGKRLWTLVPPSPHDFNVPSTIVLKDAVIAATENNGTRLYGFEDGRIRGEPLAKNKNLAPDTMTPVVVGTEVFGCFQGLYCLDIGEGLKEKWFLQDSAFDDYVSLIASESRLLVTSLIGELLLVDITGVDITGVDITGKDSKIVSRAEIMHGDSGVYSFPALVGSRLYVRGSSEIVCLELDNSEK